jgi:hypothetical protein
MRAGGIATAAANTDAAFNARVEAVIAEVVASG